MGNGRYDAVVKFKYFFVLEIESLVAGGVD